MRSSNTYTLHRDDGCGSAAAPSNRTRIRGAQRAARAAIPGVRPASAAVSLLTECVPRIRFGRTLPNLPSLNLGAAKAIQESEAERPVVPAKRMARLSEPLTARAPPTAQR